MSASTRKAEIARINGAKGGRPVGSYTRHDGKRFLMKPGETPKDVMHDNMMFWAKRVEFLSERIEDLLKAAEQQAQLDPKLLSDLSRLSHEMLAARHNAESCAVDLAPYVHPRIAALHVTNEEDSKIIVRGGLPEDGG